jgi:hypothetical protein
VTGPPDACVTCGAPAEPGQEYCLECGGRIVAARRPSAIGRSWERRFGRYPGDWIWSSLLLLLVAGGSAAAGIAAAQTRSATGGSETIVATSPVVTAPLVTPAPPRPKPTTGRRTTPAPKPAAPAARPRGALAQWPAQNGYTVVLASIPSTSSGRTEAVAKAKAALAAGVKDVGVLASSRFSSLHPGYVVVFAGVYQSLLDAQTAATKIASKYPNAYARQITR